MLDKDLLKREFPLEDGLIYLNHAGVSPWPLRTTEAVLKFARENSFSGARRYPEWLQTEMTLRGQFQRLINAPDRDEISLLKSTSEAISVVACGLEWKSGENIVIPDEEFPSNRIPWEAQQVHGVSLREAKLKVTDPESALMDACDRNTRVLSVSSVQYASGLRLDLPRLGEFCRARNILFCVDAIQSLGAVRVDVQQSGADFLMADGHKWMLGPEGVALFYCRAGLREQLTLHQYGWHMTANAGDYDARDWQVADNGRRFECGSANMLGIHAMSASLSLIEETGMDNIEKQILDNTSYLIDKLKYIDDIELLTPVGPGRHAGIVTLKVTARNTLQIYQKLIENNVICAHRGGGIRFSPHFYTPRDKIDKAIEILSLSI